MLLNFIHRRTSLCHLFFPCAPKAQYHNAHTCTKTEESGFQQCTDQKSKSKRNQGAAAKLILPAHKNTPCTNRMQGVFDILLDFVLSAVIIHGFFAGSQNF